jgi:hypothetical protein
MMMSVRRFWEHPLLGSLSAEKRRVVRRAAAGGPVPADPELRRAAGRLAAHHVDEMTHYRGLVLIGGGLLLALLVIAAVVTSVWWYWLNAEWIALVVASYFGSLRLMRRRVELFADPR